MSNRSQHKKAIIPAAAVLIILGIALLYLNKKPTAQKEDYQKISSQEYDSVFLSMYPVDTFREEDFSYYRGMSLVKASYCIPDFSVLKQYLKRIAKSGNTVTTMYLGIRPEKTTPGKLQELLNFYPGITFEIILPYPSADYWCGLSDADYEEMLTAYNDFLIAAPDITNANFYFMAAEEWLISNPSNYETEWLATESIARRIMLHSDRDHEYLVTAENALPLSQSLAELTKRIRTEPAALPDLSDYCVVFFGDSVIANYNDSTSIPGVAAGLTGASVFNCGLGGGSASLGTEAFFSLPDIVDAFFQKDLSSLPAEAETRQFYKGIEAYASNPPAAHNLCFVINYGLNDYFCGYTISLQDPYDITSYCGAIRTAVDTIRREAPDAQIILCTPTFCARFQDGTEPHGDGYILEDYVDAVISLSDELRTSLLDNYHELGITHDNQGQYLEDQVHPNAACRYLISRKIIDIIGSRTF